MIDEPNQANIHGNETRSPIGTKVRMQRANGFRILEMYEDAEEELSKIFHEDRLKRDVLTMHLAVRQDAEDWTSMLKTARILRRQYPGASEWCIAEAYALRRSESLESAREVLVDAAKRHTEDACIKYNLACYSCQKGELKEALRYLLVAVELDAKYEKLALVDEDLVEIRETLLKQGFSSEPLSNED
ncbi:MAG: hypothetical protein CMI26_00360 [Opitutae bacterium]|nr:hypothetical protein [Opitutae bacterium]|tara:strand:- start:5749 stop:6312 length:564 start_codon:yes stop_codon:yes gene_type:complete